MGASAARVGDTTSHGSPLGPGPGSLTVMIGGMPAWRASMDTHLCPLSDGPNMLRLDDLPRLLAEIAAIGAISGPS